MPDNTLQQFVERAVTLLDGERGFILRRDPETDDLALEVCAGCDRAHIESPYSREKYTITAVLNAREPMLTTNADDDPAFQSGRFIGAIRSILCAPLMAGDTIIGVFYIDRRARVGVFQETDLAEFTLMVKEAASILGST